MATLTGSTVTLSSGVTTSAYGTLDYTVGSLDPVTNTVTISGIKPHFRFSGGTSSTYVKRVSFKLYVDGTLKQTWGAYTYTADGNSHNYSTTFNDVIVTNPNSSGSSFSFSINIQCSIDIGTSIGSLKTGTSSASKTVSVTGVARASDFTLSSTSVDIGGSQGITITQYVTGATHTFSYSFLGTTGTPTISSNAWTIPTSFEDSMTTVTSASCALTLTTSVNGSDIGSKTQTFTVTIPASYVPVITLGTLTKTNTYNNQLIAGYSSFSQAYTLSMTPAGNSATVSSYTATITGGVPVSSCTSTSTTSGTFPTSTSDYAVTLTLTVTDTRGRTATQTVNVGTAKAYVSPAVAIYSLDRCLSSGTLDPSGTYAYIKVVASSDYTISSVKARVNNTDYTLTLSSGYYQGKIGGGNLSTTSQYTVTVSVMDAFMTNYSLPPVTISQIIPTMALPLSIYDDGTGTGVTLGKSATGTGFNVYMDAVFHGAFSGDYVGDQVTFEVTGTTLKIKFKTSSTVITINNVSVS